MTKKATLTLVCLLFAFMANAQLHCAYDSILAIKKRSDSAFANSFHKQMINNVAAAKKMIKGSIYQNSVKRGVAPNMANYVLPVVVHVIHKSTDATIGVGTNISVAQITNQIDNLNTYFKPYGIQFCLATKMPDGTSFNGITRKAHALTNYRMQADNDALMALDAFPQDQYINIWVVNNILYENGQPSPFVGAASYTGSLKLGMAVVYDFFGNSQTCGINCPLNSYARGKVLVHEMGHFLGLLHPHDGGNCAGSDINTCDTSGDYICDTPPMKYLNLSCIDTNTCIETPFGRDKPDPIHNLMSYKYETCIDTFTPQQLELMYFNIETYLTSVIDIDNIKFTTGSGCNLITALFKPEKYQSCIFGNILLTALDAGHSYKWTIKNTSTGSTYTSSTSSSNTLNYNFAAYGYYTITLTVTDGSYSVTRTIANIINIQNCGSVLNSPRGNWYFGEYAGLTFRQNAAISNSNSYDAGKPTLLKNQNLNSGEGCIVQNNSKGRLLFYGGGKIIINGSINLDSFYLYSKTHKKMPNGNLRGASTSAQGGIVVPMPTNGKKFYVFTTNIDNINGSNKEDDFGLRYSIVDTTLNGGDGDVETANRDKPVSAPANRYKNKGDNAIVTGEGIAAIPGCDSTHYYVIVTSLYNKNVIDSLKGKSIEVYKVTSTSVTHHSQYWLNSLFWAYGPIVADNSGRLVSVCGVLFEFDRFTGTLKLIKNLQDKPAISATSDLYTSQFSPSGNALYIIRKYSLGNGAYKNYIRQYDLTNLDTFTTTILKNNAEKLQNAPDGKLYIVQNQDVKMSYLEKPNEINDFSNTNRFLLQNDKIDLRVGIASLKGIAGLPNFIDALPQKDLSPKVYHRIENCNQVYFYTSQCCKNTYAWNFGDGNTGTGKTISHSYSGKTGTYYVTLTIDNTIILRDTIKFGFTGTQMSGNTNICDTNNLTGYDVLIPKYKVGLYKYNWIVNNGVIEKYEISKTSAFVKWKQDIGTIQVIATDKYGCKDSAKKTISFSNLISNNHINNIGTCNAANLIGTNATGGNGTFQYLWYMKGASGSFSPMSGEITKNLLPSPSKTAKVYTRYVKSGACESYSNEIEVNSIDQINSVKEFYFSDDPDKCYKRIKGTDIKKVYPAAQIVWQKSTDNINWSTFSSANDTLTFNLPKYDNPIHYRRKVIIDSTCISYSNVEDGNFINILKQPENISYCGTLQFPLKFKYKIKNNSVNDYWMRWEYKHDTLPKKWNDAKQYTSSFDSIVNISQISTNPIKKNDTIRFYIEKNGCVDYGTYSNKVVITKIDTLKILTQPQNLTVNAGNSAQFTVGTNLPQYCTFTWQYSANGTSNWTDIANSDNDTFKIQYTGACQSNYYYRVKINHPCNFKTSSAAKLTINNISTPTFDYWMKDQWTDNGTEPNTNTADLMRSQDIWLRHKKDGLRGHQTLLADADSNWVYVTVRNKGTNPTNTAKLYLYWTWGGTAEEWSRDWTTNPLNLRRNRDSSKSFPTGGEINKTAIELPYIAAGDSIRMVYHWTNLPKPTWFFPWTYGDTNVRHNRANVCFLARIETCDIDPFGMTYKEKKDILYNVGKNNNIVTKNTWIYYLNPPPDTQERVIKGNDDNGTGMGTIITRNNDSITTPIKICINTLNPAYFGKANLYVEATPNFMAAWVNGGSVSSGLQLIDDNTFKVLSANACIENVLAPVGFYEPLNFSISYININNPFHHSKSFSISVAQYNESDEKEGECWFEIQDNPFEKLFPVIEIDTTFKVCRWPQDSTLTNTHTYTTISSHINRLSSNTQVLEPTNTNEYILTQGDYTHSAIDTINNVEYLTNIHIVDNGIDTAETNNPISFNCDNTTVTWGAESSDYLVFDKNYIQQTPVTGNQYDLDAMEGKYYEIHNDISGCKVDKRILEMQDLMYLPETRIALMLADYNLEEDTCCTIELNELNCNDQPLNLNENIAIYNTNLEYLFTAPIQSIGVHSQGFKFCPPYWDTTSAHINDLQSIVYKSSTCQYCRIDFKCDNSVEFDYQTSLKSIKNSEVLVFPNPTENTINVLLTNATNQGTIILLDAIGKEVLRTTFESTNNKLQTIDVTTLPSGVYTIYLPELNMYKKVVIVK